MQVFIIKAIFGILIFNILVLIMSKKVLRKKKHSCCYVFDNIYNICRDKDSYIKNIKNILIKTDIEEINNI